jgi:hypothetical protein
MRDSKRYWDEVRQIREGLSECVWLVPAKGPGTPVQASSSVAARLLHAKSHRLATEDEVRAHQNLEASRSQQEAVEGLRRQGIARVVI